MRKHRGQHDDCFGCKIQSIQFDPKAMPTRAAGRFLANPPKDKSNSNAWERGTPTDSRGMPYLRPDLTPAGEKYVAENRSRFDKYKRRVRQSATT